MAFASSGKFVIGAYVLAYGPITFVNFLVACYELANRSTHTQNIQQNSASQLPQVDTSLKNRSVLTAENTNGMNQKLTKKPA